MERFTSENIITHDLPPYLIRRSIFKNTPTKMFFNRSLLSAEDNKGECH